MAKEIPTGPDGSADGAQTAPSDKKQQQQQPAKQQQQAYGSAEEQDPSPGPKVAAKPVRKAAAATDAAKPPASRQTRARDKNAKAAGAEGLQLDDSDQQVMAKVAGIRAADRKRNGAGDVKGPAKKPRHNNESDGSSDYINSGNGSDDDE
jgi:hypothetical protein